MTIGIATHFSEGLILCSDTRIVASGGLTSNKSKQSLSAFSSQKLVAISFAADDVPAAEMLSEEIVSAMGDAEKSNEIIPAIKKTMGRWYRSYGAVTETVPPALEFLIICVDIAHKNSTIYSCKPPATVNTKFEPVAIGCAVEIVNGFRDLLAWRHGSGNKARWPSLRSALLRMAFLMNLAKEKQGQFVGGKTDVVIISNVGSFTMIEQEEMVRAEAFAGKADALLHKMYSQMLSDGEDAAKDTAPDQLTRAYAKLVREREQLKFSHLDQLNKPIWGPKLLSSQKLTGQQ